jgi:tetratricopeptide (TPR) repeat protein
MNAQHDFLTGQKSFLEGDYRKSIASFSVALEYGLQPEKGYLALGMAHLKNADFDEAVEDFSHVLEFDHDAEQALFYRGITHLNHAELQETIDDLTRVLDLNPERSEAWVARSLAHRELHHDKEAQEDMKQALVHSGIEVEEFMRNFAISPQVYTWAMTLFDVQDEPWAVQLGEEIRKSWH